VAKSPSFSDFITRRALTKSQIADFVARRSLKNIEIIDFITSLPQGPAKNSPRLCALNEVKLVRRAWLYFGTPFLPANYSLPFRSIRPVHD
jgi:hypothetical protein